MLSDRFDEAASSPLRLADARAGDPTTAVDVAREIFDAWQARPWHEVLHDVLARRGRADRGRPRAVGSRLQRDRRVAGTAVRAALLGHPLRRARGVRPHLPSRRRSRNCSATRVGGARAARARPLLRVSRRRGRQGDAPPGPGRPADRHVGLRHGADAALASACSRGCSASADLTGSTSPAPDGFLLAYGTNVRRRPVSARRGRRSGADGALLPGRARRPRHGRVRADRPVSRRPTRSSIP